MARAGRVVRAALAAAGVVLLCVAAGTLLPRSPGVEERSSRVHAPSGAGARTVLLLSNPIHTDIALPADPDVLLRFADLDADGFAISDPALRWIVVGWGGRAFYLETPTWADLKPLPVLRALTYDSAVMHVELAGPIPLDHPAVRPLALSPAGFAALVGFVQASFARDGVGAPLTVAGAGYGPSDRFYEATGGFNALVGCNLWTAEALRHGGLTTGWWTPLPWLLQQSLTLHGG